MFVRDRYARLRRIEALDPERDGVEIRRLSMDDFYVEFEHSLRLALFRTYAVPSISALLDETGEFFTRGGKRYDDTTLLLYEIFKDGPDSERGRRAVRQLNRIHGAYDISNGDYVYTLATFVVIPRRWIARYGWRALSKNETEASVSMFRRLGVMMGLRDIPQTYAAFEQFLDAYEAEHFRFTAANGRVADATVQVFADRLPAPLRRFVRPVVSAMLDDPLRDAVGLPAPPPFLSEMFDRAFRLRARVQRRLPPAPDDRSRRHPPAPTYPNGYAIEELGPPHAQGCPFAPGGGRAPSREARHEKS